MAISLMQSRNAIEKYYLHRQIILWRENVSRFFIFTQFISGQRAFGIIEELSLVQLFDRYIDY